MAKFNISSRPGEISPAHQKIIESQVRDQSAADVQLPAEQVADAAAPPVDLSDPLIAGLAEEFGSDVVAPQPAAVPESDQVVPEAAVGEGFEPTITQAEERVNQRVEPLSQRIGSYDSFKVTDNDPFQGQLLRAENVANVLEYSEDSPSVKAFAGKGIREDLTADPTVDPYADTANPVNPVKVLADQNSFDAGIIDAQTGGVKVDPTFAVVGTIATEKFFNNQALGKSTETDINVDEMFNVDPESDKPSQVDIPTKAKGITQLGRTVWQEYMREKAVRDGKPSDEYLLTRKQPSREELDYVGAMLKETYAEANPDMVTRAQGPDGQVHFTPTNKGLQQMKTADDYAGNPFDFANEVKPLQSPSPAQAGQLQFEGNVRTREFTTDPVKRKRDESLKVITEARENFNRMGRKVDSRGKAILFQNGAAALQEAFAYFEVAQGSDHTQPAPEGESAFADTFQIGREKYQSLLGEKRRLEVAVQIAQQKVLEAGNPDAKARAEASVQAKQLAFDAYSPDQVYKSVVNKFIESLNTVARYDNQVAYNTFYTIMLNGRLGIQQNKLDPQADKVVRFALRVADKPVEVNPSQGDNYATKSFKEIATVMFLDGKRDHPRTRLQKFNEQYDGPRMQALIKLGKELNESQITPEQTAAAGDLLRQVELRDRDGRGVINIPPGLQQTSVPQYSQALKEELGKHGAEERTYVMEFLQDLANYDAAKQRGGSFSTSYEAEMDGITHGVASNGAALGVAETMLRSGVVHTGNRKLHVEGSVEGDLREGMKARILTQSDQIAVDAGAGNQVAAFTEIATLAVADKPNYLKKPPMTFIYGQELKNLADTVQATMYTGESAEKIQDIITGNNLDPEKVQNFLHSLLTESLVETLSPRAIAVSRQLRSNNVIATLTGVPLYYDNTMGFRSYFGKKDVVEDPTRSEFSIQNPREGQPASRPVYSYNEELTGGAVRKRGDKDQYGGWGHGHVIPGVVQAYDGNMISKTGSGQSHKRMSEVAKARGHVHSWLPIFDAAKTNLANIDLVRDEMNQNWWNGITNTSFVENIMGSGGWADQALKQSRSNLNAVPSGQKLNIERGQYQGLQILWDHDQLVQLYEGVLPVEREFYTKPEEMKKIAKRKVKQLYTKLEQQTNLDFGDKPTELTADQIRILTDTVIADLQILQTNKRVSAETEAARKKAFAAVRPELITQVDHG